LLHNLLHGLYLAASTRSTLPNASARVFADLTVDTVESTRRRLRDADGLRTAVERTGPWSWQGLRRTCATAIANMPGAGPWVESKALGHSVVVSERLYADRMRVDPSPDTVEAALGVVDEVTKVWAAIAGSPHRRSSAPPPAA
jgi:hypothetical protein